MRLNKGKVLYTGSRESTQSRLRVKPFVYVGQLGKRGSILYTTKDKQTAWGYANCRKPGHGWLREYELRYTMKMPRVSEHYEWDEVRDQFCQRGRPGYYVRWSKTPLVEEVVFCDPKKYLRMTNATRCPL